MKLAVAIVILVVMGLLVYKKFCKKGCCKPEKKE